MKKKFYQKKNENKENYLIEEIKMKKDINLKEIKKKKWGKSFIKKKYIYI